MSNTKKSNFKNIICSLILCIGFVISAMSGITFIPKITTNAATNYVIKDVSSDLLSSYYNFYTSSSAKPASANGWTELKDSSTNEENIIRGIVDLENETTFSTTTYHSSKPNMPKDKDGDKSYFKNLMINSYNGAGKFGYKSNSISLEENSFYSISVKVYTHRATSTESSEELDPFASIYLTGLTDDKEYENLVKFENINTLTSWSEYTFYINTNESKSVNLELWLGSKTSEIQGAVFFNYVKIQRYSEDYFIERILNNPNDDETSHIISLADSYDRPVNNSSFETTTPIDWKKIAQSTSIDNKQRCEIVNVNTFSMTTNDNKTIKAPGSNNSANNDSALFMYNQNDGYQALESSEITIGQLEYYKITFWAKSDCNIGSGATVYLVDKSTENPIESAKLTLSTSYTSGSNNYRNDWTKYSFYVYGDNLNSKQVTIQIWLGTKDSKTSGYVFIDDFRIQNIDYSNYSSNSSSTNSTSLNFNANSDLFVITNSNFDKTSNEDNNNTYPLLPTSWTKSGSSNNNTFSGVINAKEDHFNANIDKYSNTNRKPARPANHPIHADNNNVLMIGSTSENNSQTYTSEDLTLNADSYYKLSFYVLTDYDTNSNSKNSGARVNISTSTKTLFDYYNIHFEDNSWHQFVVYIKTGKSSETAKLALMFEKLTGYVFFDDIRLETSNETVFNSFTKIPGVVYSVIDLSLENFDNGTFNKDEQLQVPNNWTSKESDDLSVTRTGIINMSDSLISDIAPTLSSNENVLYIQSLHDVHYSYISKDSYNFTAKTYYKVSINVLTRNLYCENSNDEELTGGASIGFTYTSEMFLSNINTNGKWKTCTIYLCLEDDLNTSISLALGSKNLKSSGEVLFDCLRVETTDKETFLEELKTLDDRYTTTFIDYTEATEEKPEESTWENNFDWLILPSLITALAIIVAVVGFYVRKINFNRKPKIKTKYDRRKTLDKDIDRREKIALRQQIIDELNAELKSIDDEIAEYNKIAQEQLEVIKNQIEEEKEVIKRKKIEIEIKKKEATAEREKALKEDPTLINNSKAEKEFNSYLSKLDKQEMTLQKQINQKDIKFENAKAFEDSKLNKYLERKEFIKNEIAKIEAEIEEIAKEEATMWEEYKLAKAKAKAKKAEYKAQEKLEKEKTKKSNGTKKSTTTKKETDTKKEAVENTANEETDIAKQETASTETTNQKKDK